MWKVNAYCPHGVVQTVVVDDFGRLSIPAKCPHEVEPPPKPGRLRRWLHVRRFRRQLRNF